MKKLNAAFLFSIMLTGCVQHEIINPKNYASPNSTTVLEKNYVVGQVKESYVGDSMLTIKRKLMAQDTDTKAVAPTDFTISGGRVNITGKAGNIYPIRGTVQLDGKEFTVVEVRSDKFVLIDDNGVVYKKVLNNVLNNNVAMFYDFTYTPPNFVFKKESIESLSFQGNLGSDEIIYDGTDGNSFSLTYREYTGDDMIRPAFTQNLKYQNSQNKIRFKNMLISVKSVDNEKIRFVVISDD